MTEKEFLAELEQNDKQVKNEQKSYVEQNQDFAQFIAQNKCKIKGGRK